MSAVCLIRKNLIRVRNDITFLSGYLEFCFASVVWSQRLDIRKFLGSAFGCLGAVESPSELELPSAAF